MIDMDVGRDNKKKYIFGKTIPSWNEGNAINITFIITEDCNLRCKYCYITHKSSNKKMNLEIAKEFIDYLFKSEIYLKQEAIILDFIGGEPLIEINLIDEIVAYFIQVAYKYNSTWSWNYRINICTNGVNYGDDSIQKFIEKYSSKISMSITLDGTKKKHDLQRVFPNGLGSYDKIIENVPLWISQFGGQTKVTFASDDLIYLKESIISLYNAGIKQIAANVVFENVWKEGDDLIFEKQLKELADYVLENQLYDKFYCTLFDENIGGYYNKEEYYQTYCGAGKMIALGPDGKIYPCLRYKDYSLNNQEERLIGNVQNGIDFERIRPFMLASIKYQSNEECQSCNIANGCAFCQGFNYDESKIGTNFYRATYICKMHKARVRANDYYFSKLYNMYGIEKDGEWKHDRSKMLILESNKPVQICPITYTFDEEKIINRNIIDCLRYTRDSNSVPFILHSFDSFDYKENEDYKEYNIYHIFPFKHYNDATRMGLKKCIYVVDKYDLPHINSKIEGNIILNIKQDDMENLFSTLSYLYQYVDRIHVNILDINQNFNYIVYEQQLRQLKKYLEKHRNKKINLFKRHNDFLNLSVCNAGDKMFTISPTGAIYSCPLEYYLSHNEIGNIYSGIDKSKLINLYNYKLKPLCQECNIELCNRCSYLNKVKTGEYNVPPSYQCKKAIIENKIDNGEEIKFIQDPLSIWLEKHQLSNFGYYKGSDESLSVE